MRNGEPFGVILGFESDWLIGTGRNQPAGLDEVTARDAEGLPYVPGTTAIGMVRDGTESAAYAFDGGQRQGPWRQWVNAMFGGQADGPLPPRPGCLETRPLRLPPAVRDLLRSDDVAGKGAIGEPDPRTLLRRSLVVTRSGVALDRQTRTALPNMLRFGERGRAGLRLEARWTLTLPGLNVGAELPWEAELLLLAGMSLVDHVGANRRRGAGRCTLVAGAADAHRRRLTELLDRHARGDSLDAPGSPPVRTAGARPDAAVESAAHTVVELTITLLSPVIASDTTIGNVVRSLPFLPGATLLPLVQRAFGRLGPLLQSGRLVVTDATPVVDGQRGVATPLALQIGKRLPAEPGAELTVLTRRQAPRNSRPVPVGGYCTFDIQGRVHIAHPALTTQPHAVVDDDPQRPTTKTGGLYSYESMAAGTVLRAEIRFLGSRPANLDAALATLRGHQSLGRSRKDEYGSVRVDAEHMVPDRVRRRVSPLPREVVVQLTSNLILPYDPDASPPERLAAALSERLGVTLAPVEPSPDGPAPALLREFRRESWQTRWQLPRPSLSGLVAGSVIRLAVIDGSVDPDGFADRVAGVELAGIGERTAEGFGQILINPPLLDRDTVQLAGLTPASADESEPHETTPPDWWAGVETAAWRSEIIQRAVDAALNDGIRATFIGGTLTPSQLGTLRLVASGSSEDFGTRLRAWYGRIAPIRKPDWATFEIERLLNDRVVFTALALDPNAVPPTLHPFAAQQLLLALLRTAKGRARTENIDQEVGSDE